MLFLTGSAVIGLLPAVASSLAIIYWLVCLYQLESVKAMFASLMFKRILKVVGAIALEALIRKLASRFGFGSTADPIIEEIRYWLPSEVLEELNKRDKQ